MHTAPSLPSLLRTTGLIKLEIGSSRSCSIIATILDPTIFLASLPGKRQSISNCCFSSIFHFSNLIFNWHCLTSSCATFYATVAGIKSSEV